MARLTSASVRSSSTASSKDGPPNPMPPCNAPKVSAKKRSRSIRPSAGAHALLGTIYIRYADYDRALDEMRRAVKLNSSDPDTYAGLATALLWSGDVNGAVKAFEISRKLGLTASANEAFTLGIAYVLADRNDDAIRTLENSVERNKTDPYTNAILAAAYAQAGRQTDAARQVETVRRLDARFDTAEFGTLLRKPELREKLVAALKKAGL